MLIVFLIEFLIGIILIVCLFLDMDWMILCKLDNGMKLYCLCDLNCLVVRYEKVFLGFR